MSEFCHPVYGHGPKDDGGRCECERRFSREWEHFATYCFADRQTCISCGCNSGEGQACPSHKGTIRYQNYLLEQMILLKKSYHEDSGEDYRITEGDDDREIRGY